MNKILLFHLLSDLFYTFTDHEKHRNSFVHILHLDKAICLFLIEEKKNDFLLILE